MKVFIETLKDIIPIMNLLKRQNYACKHRIVLMFHLSMKVELSCIHMHTLESTTYSYNTPALAPCVHPPCTSTLHLYIYSGI